MNRFFYHCFLSSATNLINEFKFLSICYCPESDPKAWRLSGTMITDFISVWDLRILFIGWVEVQRKTGNDEDNAFVGDFERIFG